MTVTFVVEIEGEAGLLNKVYELPDRPHIGDGVMLTQGIIRVIAWILWMTGPPVILNVKMDKAVTKKEAERLMDEGWLPHVG